MADCTRHPRQSIKALALHWLALAHIAKPRARNGRCNLLNSGCHAQKPDAIRLNRCRCASPHADVLSGQFLGATAPLSSYCTLANLRRPGPGTVELALAYRTVAPVSTIGFATSQKKFQRGAIVQLNIFDAQAAQLITAQRTPESQQQQQQQQQQEPITTGS